MATQASYANGKPAILSRVLADGTVVFEVHLPNGMGTKGPFNTIEEARACAATLWAAAATEQCEDEPERFESPRMRM
ncbi:hypothetical protein PAP18089_01642 [Pandoraea apista]|uniref:Uncharacterized protein n=1 Tax=Pandoraea apista TaxID=93218 RepID=A0A5E5P260_9BURK|nr:hypothetical protein PAP18089_01642 [Pandoraea apista]